MNFPVSFRERDRVRGAQFLVDPFKHRFRVLEHLVVPDTQHTNAERLKFLSSSPVYGPTATLSVASPINFNH
jgi:hypothetical protein